MFKSFTAVLVLLYIIAGCTPAPRFTSRNEKPPEVKSEKDETKTFNDTTPLESVTGIASYYSDEFNGKPTYSGEIYDMYGVSAAHPTYPMGTKIRVTNLSNLKSIELVINDRMPYRPDRIIDLSLGAAMELGMVQDGLAEIRIDVLEWGKGKK